MSLSVKMFQKHLSHPYGAMIRQHSSIWIRTRTPVSRGIREKLPSKRFSTRSSKFNKKPDIAWNGEPIDDATLRKRLAWPVLLTVIAVSIPLHYLCYKYILPKYVTTPAEDALPEYRGLDWKGRFQPALDVQAATDKLRNVQSSRSFSPKDANDVTRVDSIGLPSNSPVEDSASYDELDVGQSRPWRFWGVYDGHAGWVTSSVLSTSLANYVAREMKEAKGEAAPESIEKTIKRAFLRLDDEIISTALQALSDDNLTHAEVISRIAPAQAGSCALLACHDPATSLLHVACTGDSRAVLGRLSSTENGEATWTAVPLSEDQTGFNKSEVERITAAHPGETEILSPKSGRLLGIAVTRGFGDNRWKWPLTALKDATERFSGKPARPHTVSQPYMTAEPEVVSINVSSGDFLILACDGFWDQMKTEDAVKCVSMWIEAKRKGKALDKIDSSTDISLDAELKEILLGTKSRKFADMYYTRPEHFIVEDDNVATHLTKNTLGGKKREQFCSLMTAQAPGSRDVRDDITIQVVFFGKAF